MSNLEAFAKFELELAELDRKDSEYNGMLSTAVMNIIKVFGEQEFSGFSAQTASNLVHKLSRFEPITPLTGNDDEWTDVTEISGFTLYQNKRCARVFRENGKAYDMDGKVFRDPDGTMWTNGESRVPVTFPYTPTTEIVDREATDDV